MSRSRDIARILGRSELENTQNLSFVNEGDAGNVDSDGIQRIAQGTGITWCDSLNELPTANLVEGDRAFVEGVESAGGTSRLYISNGYGWYNATSINLTPYWDTEPDGAYTIVDSETPLIITAKARDSDGSDVNLLHQSTVDDSAQYLVDITRDSSVYTFTPKSADSVGEEVTNGNLADSNNNSFNYNFKWSDGINFVTKAVTITYNFGSALDALVNANVLLHYLDASKSECTDGLANGTINDLGTYTGTWTRYSGAADTTVDGVDCFDHRSQYFQVATGQTQNSPMSQIYLIYNVSSRGSWGTGFRNNEDHAMLLQNTGEQIGMYDNGPNTFYGFGTNAPVDEWCTVIINSASNSSSTLYLNGVSSGTVSFGLGANTSSRTTYRMGWPSQGLGYYGVAAMGNRQLTTAEITSIHDELIARVS